ncbi:MAG: ABC transporter ATP-binding protein [Caulobacterales bacterium]
MSLPQPGPILIAKDVSHAFGARKALKGVDLEVRPHEIYALLGPNGAGKTTLTRAICGRFKPDGGEIRIAGADPHAAPAARAKLGLAPQTLALYSHLTVRENLEVFGRLAGVKGAALGPAVDHAMRVTHVADRARVPVKHLSGGYQRRVNIAAAMLHSPRLLVLDEPTVGVDQAAREAVDEVIRALRDEGVGVLMITHDLEQAGALADRVGFLREGEKVLEGRPADLIAEAFGDMMEVQVVLADEPDPDALALLKAESLKKAGSPGAWSLFVTDGYETAAALDAKLREAGVQVREIRVRRPTLSSLFAVVAERDPRP